MAVVEGAREEDSEKDVDEEEEEEEVDEVVGVIEADAEERMGVVGGVKLSSSICCLSFLFLAIEDAMAEAAATADLLRCLFVVGCWSSIRLASPLRIDGIENVLSSSSLWERIGVGVVWSVQDAEGEDEEDDDGGGGAFSQVMSRTEAVDALSRGFLSCPFASETSPSDSFCSSVCETNEEKEDVEGGEEEKDEEDEAASRIFLEGRSPVQLSNVLFLFIVCAPALSGGKRVYPCPPRGSWAAAVVAFVAFVACCLLCLVQRFPRLLSDDR